VNIIAILVLKFLLYCGVVAAASRLLPLQTTDTRSFVLKWSALRLGLGLLFGMPILWLYGYANDAAYSEVQSYALSFGIVRVVEWAILLALVLRHYSIKPAPRHVMFVLLGVAANVGFDLIAHLAGAEDHLKFVC
jgi:hypothetical protein